MLVSGELGSVGKVSTGEKVYMLVLASRPSTEIFVFAKSREYAKKKVSREMAEFEGKDLETDLRFDSVEEVPLERAKKVLDRESLAWLGFGEIGMTA